MVKHRFLGSGERFGRLVRDLNGMKLEEKSGGKTCEWTPRDKEKVYRSLCLPTHISYPAQVLEYRGIRNCLPGVKALYPAFDVVPPELIAGVVTDRGVYAAAELDRYFDGGAPEFY